MFKHHESEALLEPLSQHIHDWSFRIRGLTRLNPNQEPFDPILHLELEVERVGLYFLMADDEVDVKKLAFLHDVSAFLGFVSNQGRDERSLQEYWEYLLEVFDDELQEPGFYTEPPTCFTLYRLSFFDSVFRTEHATEAQVFLSRFAACLAGAEGVASVEAQDTLSRFEEKMRETWELGSEDSLEIYPPAWREQDA